MRYGFPQLSKTSSENWPITHSIQLSLSESKEEWIDMLGLFGMITQKGIKGGQRQMILRKSLYASKKQLWLVNLHILGFLCTLERRGCYQL